MGRDGSDRGARKIAQLRDNANYMRTRLTEMGCLVLGDYDSPILVRFLIGLVLCELKGRKEMERYLVPSVLLLGRMGYCH